MGMAASQCNFGALTRRKHDIGMELERCTMQKNEQTRATKRVTQKYQNALNSKVYKWTNNSGISSVDLSYSTLMRPTNANQYKPYLLTDTSGRVVVDEKYKEFAEMISPDGKPGGDWESNRTKVLAKLVGISEDDINNSVAAKATADASASNYEKIRQEYNILESKEPTVKRDNAKDFISKAGTVSGNDIAKLYQSSGKINLGNSSSASGNLKSLLDGMAKNLSRYLTPEDNAAFQKACEGYLTNYSSLFSSSSDQLKNSGTGFTKEGNDYYINVNQMVEELLGNYEAADGSHDTSSADPSKSVYFTRDTESTEWKNWKSELDAKKAEMDAAKAVLNSDVDKDNQSLTADQEQSIKFYDRIFTAIAEKGWSYNGQIEDNDYINNMLQNNQFFITTMENKTDDDGKEYYAYEDSLASNFDNIISVNNKNAQEEALVEYEYEKAIINEKESRIDTRMKNLETELSSINNVIKGIETVRNENIERTMNWNA